MFLFFIFTRIQIYFAATKAMRHVYPPRVKIIDRCRTGEITSLAAAHILRHDALRRLQSTRVYKIMKDHLQRDTSYSTD